MPRAANGNRAATLWTPERVEQARQCLAESATLGEAAGRFSIVVGRPVTAAALQTYFVGIGEPAGGLLRGRVSVSNGRALEADAPVVSVPQPREQPGSNAGARAASNDGGGQPHGARIRRSTERILFIPDTHVPFEDARAWDVMMDVARAVRPETIVILGDFADMWAVSAHDKSPTRRENLESEMKAVASRLDELDSLGAKRKLYVEGNHEERLTRYMTQRAPDVFEYVQYRKIQRLDERGWQWVPYREHAKIGKVFVTHDLGEAGMYAAARARGTMGGNVVIGHVHRMQVNYASVAEGTGHVSAAFGWLGDSTKATYMPAAKRAAWQLGFGLGYMEPATGNVHLQAVPIVDYRCVVEGSLFGGRAAA